MSADVLQFLLSSGDRSVTTLPFSISDIVTSADGDSECSVAETPSGRPATARAGRGMCGDWSGERRLSVGRTLAMPTAGASWIQVSHTQITMFLLTHQ